MSKNRKRILWAFGIAILAVFLALMILRVRNGNRYVWGINFKITNQTEEDLRYVGLATRSIQDNPSIDFSGYMGGTEYIWGVLKEDTLDDSEIECSAGSLAPGETVFLQWEGQVKGESLIFVFLNEDGLVRLIPAAYVFYADSLNYVEAVIVEEAAEPGTGLVKLKTFDTFPSLIPWWIRIQYDFIESEAKVEL